MMAAFYRDRDTIIAKVFIVFFAILPFSYVPTISLGFYANMHLDISLIYLTLAVTAVLCFALTPIRYYWDALTSYRQRANVILLGLVAYGLYAAISIAWSTNPIKGLVTAGYLCLIIFVVLTMYVYRSVLIHHRHQLFYAIGAPMTLAVIFGYWQVGADALGLSSLWTQLPAAYQSPVFGFARPTGFSLEPQFFGSLLVPAVLYLTYRIVFRPPPHQLYRCYTAFVLFFAMTLMTLSRGAIFSLAISSLLLLIFGAYAYRESRPLLPRLYARYAGLVAASVLLSCGFIIAAAQINTRDTITGTQAVIKYVNQLSLGTITIDVPQVDTAPASPPNTIDPVVDSAPGSTTPTTGYVQESTNSRLLMSKTALELWSSTPLTALTGVGFGGYGVAAHQKDSALVPHSIVNNYYLEVLVETGVVGASLLFFAIGILIYRLFDRRHILLFCITIGIAVQMLFYSGNANTIHVWVCIGLGTIALSLPSKSNSTLKKDTQSPTIHV